jgi:4'-phosphopantetheinyl transferase
MWERLPSNLLLKSNDVHIWRLELNLPINQVNLLQNVLSKDEQKRADKFRFKHLQHRFIMTRATLKMILAQYLQISPEQVEFSYTPKGKPSLAPWLNNQRIEFNLSHSEDIALYGFNKERKIGIDIEKIRSNCEIEQLAQRFFTLREYQIIRQLQGRKKQQAFFQAWTSKEAYLKAIGEGLGGGLDQIEIDLNTEERKLVKIKGDQQAIINWRLLAIEINDDYLATLAVEGTNQYQIKKYSCQQLIERICHD